MHEYQVDADAHEEETDIYEDEPRQIQLVLRRINPWTVLKQSFMLAVAFGIASVLATVMIWLLLDVLHVWSSIKMAVESMDSSGPLSEMLHYLELPRVTALATVFAVINTVLTTVLLTLGAVLYNLAATLVGGIRATLTDE